MGSGGSVRRIEGEDRTTVMVIVGFTKVQFRSVSGFVYEVQSERGVGGRLTGGERALLDCELAEASCQAKG
jgi:hypothetical protein